MVVVVVEEEVDSDLQLVLAINRKTTSFRSKPLLLWSTSLTLRFLRTATLRLQDADSVRRCGEDRVWEWLSGCRNLRIQALGQEIRRQRDGKLVS